MASINAFVGRPDLLDCKFCVLTEFRLIALLSNCCFSDTSTKGAIVSFTRGLSNQILAEKVIRVNGVFLRLCSILGALMLNRPCVFF